MSNCETAATAEDATSGEDELEQPKALPGTGWVGRSVPVMVGRGARVRPLQDGGGLCSPGRWPSEARVLPPARRVVHDILVAAIRESEQLSRGQLAQNWLAAMACGKAGPELFEDTAHRAREGLGSWLRGEVGGGMVA